MIGEIIRLIFGWQEVMITYDSKQFYRTKGMLVHNAIKTRSTIVRHMSRGRGRGLPLNIDSTAMYYIYVRKDNLSKAKNLIGQLKG